VYYYSRGHSKHNKHYPASQNYSNSPTQSLEDEPKHKSQSPVSSQSKKSQPPKSFFAVNKPSNSNSNSNSEPAVSTISPSKLVSSKSGFLDNLNILLYSFTDKEKEKAFENMIIENGGNIHKNFNTKTTHVVSFSDQPTAVLKALSKSKNCKIVTREWLEQTLESKKLEDESNFLIKLT